MEAINSPTGHIVEAVFKDLRLAPDERATIQVFLKRIEECLLFSDDPRWHSIAVTCGHLGWLYHIDAPWTERHLFAILDGHDEGDKSALWAGFFWNPEVASARMYLRMKDGLLNISQAVSDLNEVHGRSLAFLILLGWIKSDENDGLSWISDAEFRNVLLSGSDAFRSHVLWQIEHGLRDVDPDGQTFWQSKSPEFFANVWPRQRVVKTSQMSARILECLLSNPESFDALFDTVLPLMTTIDNRTGSHIHFRNEAKETVKAHPVRFLKLLHAVLPVDARLWPYGSSEALEMVVESAPELIKDGRLIELRRRWIAR